MQLSKSTLKPQSKSALETVFGKIEAVFSGVETFVVVLGLGLMCAILFIQVFSRYLLNSPLVWSEELARYIFLWVSFFGLSYGIRKNTHIRMELIFNLFPPMGRRILQIILNLIMLFLMLYLIPPAVSFVYKMSSILAVATKVSMGLVYAALPIGFSMAAIRLLINTIRLLTIRKGGEI